MKPTNPFLNLLSLSLFLLPSTTTALPLLESNPSSQQPPTHWQNPTLLFTRYSTLHPLHRRLLFSPGAQPSDYCGEANPTFSTDPSSPLSSDCQSLAAAYPSNAGGFWTLTSADSVGTADGYVKLASRGTCGFKVRLDPGYGDQLGGVDKYFFGSNDLRFYVSQAVQSAKNGRIKGSSPVWCGRDGIGKPVVLEWFIYKV